MLTILITLPLFGAILIMLFVAGRRRTLRQRSALYRAGHHAHYLCRFAA